MISPNIRCCLILILGISYVTSHGLLWDPPNRSSLWRLVPNLPVNTEDNQNFCGGKTVQWESNGGKCGPCGDNWTDAPPRANENTGRFGNGVIGRTYHSGSNIQVQVNLTASHKGHFEFTLCDLKDSTIETEECFLKHPLFQLDGRAKYLINTPELENTIDHFIYLRLPQGLTCERCVLRWHYWTSNSVGLCTNGTYDFGCGAQEVFRSCSDIAIV